MLARLAPRQCPICGRGALRFEARPGTRDRPTCPGCGSQQRHRHLWLFLERETDLLDGRPKRVLHFAPEPGLEARLRAVPHLELTTADLEPGHDLQLDLMGLALTSDQFDVVLCNHVLEHVPDAQVALAEIRRVLRPGGWAVVQVPVQGPTTVEDAGEADPDERRRRFGQEDHLRQFGRDYEDRLRAAGFEVDLVLYRDQLPLREQRRFGLRYDLEDVFGVDFNAIPEPWEVWRVVKPAA